MISRLTATGIAVGVLAPFGAQAEDVIVLDKITASANYEVTTTDHSGSSVDIVTGDDLQNTEQTRAVDYLARLPGVSVRTRGPLGSQTGMTIRGVSQTNIAVRVNGIDVTDPSGPQVAFDFGSLTTMDIGRIEVLKGSQSAVYGANAIGGVVDITTKRATKPGTEQSATLEYGADNTVKGSYSFASKASDHELAFTLSHVKSDGFSAADQTAGNTERDGFRADRLSFYGNYTLDSGVTFELTGFAEHAKINFDDFDFATGLPVDGTPDDVTDNTSHGLRAAVQFATGAIDNAVELAWFDIDRNLTGTNSFGPYDFSYLGQRATLGYHGATDLGARARLVFGATRVKETYRNDFGFGATGYHTYVNSGYGELTLTPGDRTDITVTARHDDHSQFGGFWTGRLAAVFRARDDLIFRASLANGYRAPSSFELFDPFAGDPTLQPETSVSADFGVEKRFGDRSVLKATAFYIAARDIIDYSFTTFAYYQAAGTSRRAGVELSADWTFDGGLGLTGAYTYTDSSGSALLDSSSWLTSTPRHMLSLGVSYDITPALSATLNGLYQADRSGLPDMSVFDTTVSYAIDDSTQAYVRVENLFDKQYQMVPGYGTSDRAFYVGLRKTF